MTSRRFPGSAATLAAEIALIAGPEAAMAARRLKADGPGEKNGLT